MRRAHLILLIAMGSLGLVLVLLSVTASHAAPTLAAPRVVSASVGLPAEDLSPLVQGAITCRLATTTTDNLAYAYNYTYTNAAPLSNYSGLALATGDRYDQKPADDDWFRLDNATADATYVIEAIPDRTDNYNLGIVVYNIGLVEIKHDTDTTNNTAKVELRATGAGPYYLKIYQLTPQCSGDTYHLNFTRTDPTPTPEADGYEENNTIDHAYLLPVGTSASVTDANFVPVGGGPTSDVDWYGYYVKAGRRYQASTSNLDDVDTYVEIYTRDGAKIASDNDGGGGFASEVEWSGAYDGYYYVLVTNLIATTGIYDMTIDELSPTATPTEGPTSTPVPGATAIPGTDAFEPNFDFAHASTLAANVTYSANLIPWAGGTEDNDFYKVWIKPGLHFTCATSELGPGVDTNMIVYDGNHNAIGGNDDVTLGDYSSRFAYFSTYEGWLYVLVGTGGRLPITDVKSSDYKIRCEMQVPGQATATSTPEAGEAPPPPATPVPPAPTPLPPEELTVRPLTTPTPASAVTPAPRFIPITLLVYYDAKDDQQPGAGEGIAGISAQAYDATTNQLLAQGFTDEQGNLQFTVSAQGPVRVAVPFFGFSQLVAGEGASIYLRVPPQPLPGGAP